MISRTFLLEKGNASKL